jgi:amino acid adenylation domain-containing protein
MQFLLHHYLRDSAERTPQATAVVDRDRTLSYRELDARSDQLAARLLELGVSRGDRVGFYLDKSLESMVALYGILKAGAAYVPFDPYAPAARLGYIAANAGIRHLVTGVEKAGEWSRITDAGAPLQSLLVLNGVPEVTAVPSGLKCLTPSEIEGGTEAPPHTAAIAFDLAYILYTSGSTGFPKGVMLTHQNAMAFVDWSGDELGVTRTDRLSSHAPFHFDLSIFDVFAAARAGATLVLVPPEASFFPVDVANFLREQEITVWYSVPSILSMLTQRGGLSGGDFPRLRTMLFAGEVFPTKFLRKLMGRLPHVSFYNLYGPTETNVCTFYRVPTLPADQTEPIPIGHAIPNDEVFAVTAEGTLAEPGQVGELYVRGATVMQGYWADSERTDGVLIENPFGPASEPRLRDRVYRTGDLVCLQPDGNYKFLGRRDHQIKSRGYRIELGDIENAMYSHADVVECAVVAVPDEMIGNRIKAFSVVRNGLTKQALVRHCSTRIPKYMIPESIDLWDELPKTSTGKIDRQILKSESMR